MTAKLSVASIRQSSPADTNVVPPGRGYKGERREVGEPRADCCFAHHPDSDRSHQRQVGHSRRHQQLKQRLDAPEVPRLSHSKLYQARQPGAPPPPAADDTPNTLRSSATHEPAEAAPPADEVSPSDRLPLADPTHRSRNGHAPQTAASNQKALNW